MSFLLQPLQLVLTVLSEVVRKEQQEVIESIQLENQIRCEKLGGKRVLLNDDQRRVLAVKGKALGYTICSSTVANILKQHDIEPAPTRQRTISWLTFLQAHWDAFDRLDLDAIILWLSGMARFVVGQLSPTGAIPCCAVVESREGAPRPTILAIHVARLPGTVTHLTRGPPIVAELYIPPPDVRRVA